MNAAAKRPRSVLAWIAAVAALLVAGWLAHGLTQGPRAAPQVQITLLSGQKLDSAELAGKVLVLNFWATSCATCIKEMPMLADTYEKLGGKGLEMIAVAMAYDPPMYVKNFAETRKLPFKIALDSDGSVANAFGKVQLTPTTIVLDKRGRILRQYVGEPDWPAFHALLEKALAEPA